MRQPKSDDAWAGRTFDDFLIRPQLGITESRRDTALTSRLTTALSIELPIVSANMDSVTGWEMAQAMALEGGVGIIHRALPIDRQAEMVRRVKRSYGAVIEQPFRLPRGTSIREAKSFARRHSIHAILIEESEGSGILAGLLTSRDIPWLPELEDRPVDEFMTPFERLHASLPGIPEEAAERLMFEHRIERLPPSTPAPDPRPDHPSTSCSSAAHSRP
jgi:IMP dehydrogenase